MQYERFSFRRRRSWSARVWSILFLLALLLLVVIRSGSAQTNSTPSTSELIKALQTADASLTSLEVRLQTRIEQVQSLQKSYDEATKSINNLSQSLAEAQASQSQSEAALTEISGLLDSLKDKYAKLSQSLEAYRKEAEGQIKALEAERTLWFWLTIGAGALAAGLGIVAALK